MAECRLKSDADAGVDGDTLRVVVGKGPLESNSQSVMIFLR